MLGLYVTVPIACFRKGLAREYLETEALPPPATCYGFLLSLVGEINRNRHIGCRVTAALIEQPDKSTVLRTVWRMLGSGADPAALELILVRRAPVVNGRDLRGRNFAFGKRHPGSKDKESELICRQGLNAPLIHLTLKPAGPKPIKKIVLVPRVGCATGFPGQLRSPSPWSGCNGVDVPSVKR